jgi:hypothetical protein
MRKPFGRWAAWLKIPLLMMRVDCYRERALCQLRRAFARGAGVVRTSVVLIARRAERERVRRVIPESARRARWFYARVVRSCGCQNGTRDQRPNRPMQPTASRARSSAF